MSRLIATVNVISPMVGASYARPVVTVNTDTQGRYKIVIDLVSVLDQISLQASKNLREQQVWTDAAAHQVAKSLTDRQNTADLAYRAVSKATQNNAQMSDALAYQVAKEISEQQVLVDAVSSQVAKRLADNQPVFNDRQTRAVNKLMPVNYYTLGDFFQDNYVQDAWVDFASMQDTLSRVVQYRRVYNEVYTPVDALGKTAGKNPNDTQPIADSQRVQFSKTLQDAFGVIDTATVGDGIAFFANKFAANLVTPSDRYTSALTKVLNEAVMASDSGQLMSQSYSNMSYFAADYVGSSRYF